MIAAAQCRAARGLLNWSQEDLASRSGITKKTIADFERGSTVKPRPRTIEKITEAFTVAGIKFPVPGGVIPSLAEAEKFIIPSQNSRKRYETTENASVVRFSAVQCKMARAALGWDIRTLARAALMSPDTVARFERGEYLRPRTIKSMIDTFESSGIEFVPNGVIIEK
jgi:transcriptional regulator with XRE-family HTH domain